MSDVPDAPDNEFVHLLKRIREGDERAAAELVAKYEGIIRRRARRLLSPALRVHFDSVDIAQSVNRSLLIGLRRAAFTISTSEDLIRLVLTLVRRRVARHWRKHKREAEFRKSAENIAAAGHQGRAIPVDSSNSIDRLHLEETTRQLLDHLDGLDRQLVELRLEGHTTAEAARKLGVSPGLLRSRLSRLRKRLWEQGLSPDIV